MDELIDTEHMDLPSPTQKEAGSHGNSVRRPMNAFLIFCKRHRTVVREKNSHLDNRSVTRILGEMWANLPQEEKGVYIDLAKQYKDAFMRANPDYKWHDPSRTATPQVGGAKSPTKLLPGQPLTLSGHLSRDHIDLGSGITPGKLADPSNMGGLSLLLMAGQHSSPPCGSAPVAPPVEVKKLELLRDLQCHETPEDLTELDETEKVHAPMDGCRGNSEGVNQGKDPPLNPRPADNTALGQLAEMCTSQFKAPPVDQPPITAPVTSIPSFDGSNQKMAWSAASGSLPTGCFLTPPWTPKYDSFSPTEAVSVVDKFPSSDKGLDLSMCKVQKSGDSALGADKNTVDLYCHEKVTSTTDFCKELDRKPLVDQIMRGTRELPGCAFPQRPLHKDLKQEPLDVHKGAAADLLRVLNAPTKVDNSSLSKPVPLPAVSPRKPEHLGDLSQLMVERVIETVYSRNLLSCNPLEDKEKDLRKMSPSSRPQAQIQSSGEGQCSKDFPGQQFKLAHTFGEIQETLIRQAVKESCPREDFADRVREQLKKVTTGAFAMATPHPWGGPHPGRSPHLPLAPPVWGTSDSSQLGPTRPAVHTHQIENAVQSGQVKQETSDGCLTVPSQDALKQEVQKNMLGVSETSNWWEKDTKTVKLEPQKDAKVKKITKCKKQKVNEKLVVKKAPAAADTDLTSNILSGTKVNLPADAPPGGKKVKQKRKPAKSAVSETSGASDSNGLPAVKRKRKSVKKTVKTEAENIVLKSDNVVDEKVTEKPESEDNINRSNPDSCQEEGPESAGRESDTESDTHGRRKSKRSNRGQRYKELLSQGVLQPARRKYEPGDDNNNHHSALTSQGRDLDADFLPGTAKRSRRRTMSENAKDEGFLDRVKRYKPGDFDLEAHIASLPVCSINSNSQQAAVKHMKVRSKSYSNNGVHDNGGYHSNESSNSAEKSPGEKEDQGSEPLNIAELRCVTKTHLKGEPPVVSTNQPLVGSRKRKARTQAITHLLPMSAYGGNDVQTEDKVKAQETIAMATARHESTKENEDHLNQMPPPTDIFCLSQMAAPSKPLAENFSLTAFADIAIADQQNSL